MASPKRLNPVKSFLQWTSATPLRLYFAVLLLTILPISMFSYYADRLLRAQTEREAQNENLQQAELTSVFLQDHFRQRIALLQAYATDPDFLQAWNKRDLKRVQMHMMRALALQTDAALVSVYEADGTMRAIAPNDPNVVGMNFAFRDWYKGVAANWKPYVSEVYRTRAAPQQLAVAISVPVKDSNGNVTGIIAAAYSLRQITDWLRRVGSYGSRSILVLDQNGQMVAGPNVDIFAPPVNASGFEPVRRVARGEAGAGIFDQDGQSKLVGYVPLEPYHWSVLVEQPAEAVHSGTWRVRRPIVLFGFVFALLAVISGIVVSALHRSREELLQRVQALAESEASYRSLIQGAIIGIYRSDERGFTSVNPALVSMLGYDSEEDLLRADLANDIYLDPGMRLRLVEQYRGGEHASGVEVKWKRKDGTPIVVRISGRSVEDPDRPFLFEGIVENITERRSLEEQLRRSEKLAAVGQVVAGVAHEILNPLTAILGYAEIIASDESAPASARGFADKIRHQARRTKTITANLLSFARQVPGDKTLVDVNHVIENAMRLQDFNVGPGKIAFGHAFGSDLPKINGNEYQLLEVCLHVLNNSSDAVEDAAEKKIFARTYLQDHWVVIEITDSGPGIPDPEHAFDPFYTTKPIGKGVGLGLSACYGIVQDHAGQISCFNRMDGGATVLIKLPVAVQGAAAATAPTGASA